MALNKNDKGLTLIELLITIAVIAIVAAISVPVITNVIADSRTNSAAAMQEQAQAFIDKYEASGDWSFDTASQTFLGGIDEDGNGTVALGSVASPGAEVIDTLAVDAGQFTATVAGTTATVVAAGNGGNTSQSGWSTVTTYTWPAFSGPAFWFGTYNNEVILSEGNTSFQTISAAQVGDYISLQGSVHPVNISRVEIVDIKNTDYGMSLILSQDGLSSGWLEGISGSPFGGTPYYDMEGTVLTIERLN